MNIIKTDNCRIAKDERKLAIFFLIKCAMQQMMIFDKMQANYRAVKS